MRGTDVLTFHRHMINTRKTKMAATGYLILIVAVSAAFASDVPVLMWSPERPLSDLPQAPALDRIPQDTFHSNYLARLLGKESNVLVAFVQDKLNINDISKYADVYNPQSDGGAFKNVKGFLDELFSLELPRVLGSHLALDSFRDNFAGSIHEVTSASGLDGLDLGDKGSHLVIVRLQPVAGAHNVEAAIAANDDLIGQVSRQLLKMKVKFTALYTARTSQEREKRDAHHHSRQLMEKPQDSTDMGVFFNVSYGNSSLYAYLMSVYVCAVHNDPQNMPTYCPLNLTIDAKALGSADLSVKAGGNGTVTAVLTMNNVKRNTSSETFNISLTMPFKHQLDRWEIMAAHLVIRNSSGTFVDSQMLTRGYDPVVPLLYSFHCSSMEWYPANNNGTTLGYITLYGFQVQPFNVQEGKFLLSQDCVGWFSVGIWMGLVSVGLHVVILLFGIYMIMSLSTNDRFDDPKGKALIVNSGE